jgi:uncharacterized protein YndB with AHSA1/START domain
MLIIECDFFERIKLIMKTNNHSCVINSRLLKDLKKYYTIAATPEEVYLALTNPLSIALWTGGKAEMGNEPGSRFSIFYDSITGTNLEFDHGKKLVQQWDFGDQEPASVVTIKLHEHKHGTSVEVRHTNIPDEAWEDISSGWDDTYMASLADFFD